MAIDRHHFIKLREGTGKSQTLFAKTAGVSQQLISQIESGVNATTRKLPKIARALGVPVSELDPEFSEDTQVVQSVEAPLISWVSAGQLAEPSAVQDMRDAPRVSAPGLDPKGEWIALTVEGDSMDRISPPDSVIFVNLRDRRLVPNGCYVIADEQGGATYKRYRPNPDRWEPVSVNPVHEPVFLDAGQAVSVVGRVRKTVLDM